MIRTDRGLTLVELAVVVVILGILVAVVVPNLWRMTMNAKVAAVKENMYVVQVTVEDFATRNNGEYPRDAGSVTADGGLTFVQILPGAAGMPVNPFTEAPTVLDWSNALGTAPVTDPAGGIALNVAASGPAGSLDSYDIVGEDEAGRPLSLVLTNR